jgi:hypothetical protein
MVDLIAAYTFEQAELAKLQAKADDALALEEALAVQAFAKEFLWGTVSETRIAELDRYVNAMPDDKAEKARSWIESKKAEVASRVKTLYGTEIERQIERLSKAKAALDKARD